MFINDFLIVSYSHQRLQSLTSEGMYSHSQSSETETPPVLWCRSKSVVYIQENLTKWKGDWDPRVLLFFGPIVGSHIGVDNK